MIIQIVLFLFAGIALVTTCDSECQLCFETTGSCIKCITDYNLIDGKCISSDKCGSKRWRLGNEGCVDKCEGLQLWNLMTQEKDCFPKIECPVYSNAEGQLDIWQVSFSFYKGKREEVKVKVLGNNLQVFLLKTNEIIYEYFTQNGNIIELQIIESQNFNCLILGRTSLSLIIIKGSSNQLELDESEILLELNDEYELKKTFAKWKNQSILITNVSVKLNYISVKTFNQESNFMQDHLNQKVNQIDTIQQIYYLDDSILIGSGNSPDSSSSIVFSIIFNTTQPTSTSIEYSSLCSIPILQQEFQVIYLSLQQQVLIFSSNQIFLSITSPSEQLQSCTPSLSIESVKQILLINDSTQLIIISTQNILLYSLETLIQSPSNNTPLDKIDNISQYQLKSCMIYQQKEIICYDITHLYLYLITIMKFNTLLISSLIQLIDPILHFHLNYPQIFILSEQYTIFFPDPQSTSLTLKTCYYSAEYSNNSEEFITFIHFLNDSYQIEPFSEFQFRFLYILLSENISQNDIQQLSLVSLNFIIIYTPQISKSQISFNDFSSLQFDTILQDFTLNIDDEYNIPIEQYHGIILQNVDVKISSLNAQIQLNNYQYLILENVTFSNIQIKKQPLFILNNCKSIIMINVTISNSNIFSSLIQSYQISEIIINGINIFDSIFSSTPIFKMINTFSFELLNSNLINNVYQDTEPINSNEYGLALDLQGIDNIYINNIIAGSNKNIAILDYNLQYLKIENKDLVVKAASEIILYNNTFYSNICMNCQLLTFKTMTFYSSDNTFINNKSVISNGTLYIEMAISYLQRCNFTQNTAYSGGAIFFNKTASAQIVSSFISKNTAISTGGGITFVGSLGVLNSTNIQYNSAIIGGGIRIEQGWLYFVHWDSNSIIMNNIAEIYGQNVISRLVKREIFINNIKMIELGDDVLALINYDILKYEDHFQLQKALLINNIRSGQQIEILIKLYDVDGTQFSYNPKKISSYPLKIQQDIQSIAGVLSSYAVQVVGEIQITNFSVEKGGYVSKQLTVYGAPNQTLPIFLIENYIEFITKDSQLSRFRYLHQQVINESTKNQYNKTSQFEKIKRILGEVETVAIIVSSEFVMSTGIVIVFRECVNGEILKDINTELKIVECLPCPLNSYTLQNNEIDCHKCPDSAEVCQNNTIILKDGYWRKNRASDDIFPCDALQNNCLEFTLRDSKLQCAIGSIGPLCQGCDIKGLQWKKSFTKTSGSDKCIECDNGVNQLVYVIIIFFFTSIYLTMLVWLSIKSNIQHSLVYYLRMMGIASISNTYKRVSNQYIKLLVHYLQIIAVINQISFQLPNVLNFIPNFSGNPSSSMILSTSCLFNQIGIKNIMKYKVIQSMLLPVIYSIVVIVIWYLLKFIKKEKFKLFREQFMYSKLIFLAIFFQPDSVMFLLSAVGCRRLGDKEYLIADANYECYITEDYYEFLYSFTIPSLLIWSLFPLYILFFLYKRRFNLDSVKTIKTFGYLYLEYKPSCYFFEFVRSFFKITIVAMFILINTDNTLKLDCIMLLISLYIIFSHKLKPFQNNLLAHMDSSTHLVLLFLLLLLVLKEHQSNITNVSTNLNIAIVLVNILYISMMVTLIVFIKLKEYPKLLNLIISTLNRNLGKYFTCLQHIKINTDEVNSRVFKRWRFLRQNVKSIIMQRINQIYYTPQNNQVNKDSESNQLIQKKMLSPIIFNQKEKQNNNNITDKSNIQIINSYQTSPQNTIHKNFQFVFSLPQEQDKIIQSEFFEQQDQEINKNIGNLPSIVQSSEMFEYHFGKGDNVGSTTNRDDQKVTISQELKQYQTPNYQGFQTLNFFSHLKKLNNLK